MNQPNPNQSGEQRRQMIAAIAEQQGQIGDLDKQASLLAEGQSLLATAIANMAVAAGVGDHPAFAPIVRAAGLQTRADSAQNPEGAPATTTEEAKKPQATDDVNSPGAAPGEVNKDVTPQAVTDVNNSNVAASPDLLKGLQDVTAPVSGTDSVHGPAATGEGRVTVGNPEGGSFDKPSDSGWKASSLTPEQERERFSATLRLARLQIHAGLAPAGTVDDLSLGHALFASTASIEAINAQAETLKQVNASRPAQQPTTAAQAPVGDPRRLVPQQQRGAGIQPMAARVQPSFAEGLPTTAARADEDEWMVGSVDGMPEG